MALGHSVSSQLYLRCYSTAAGRDTNHDTWELTFLQAFHSSWRDSIAPKCEAGAENYFLFTSSFFLWRGFFHVFISSHFMGMLLPWIRHQTKPLTEGIHSLQSQFLQVANMSRLRHSGELHGVSVTFKPTLCYRLPRWARAPHIPILHWMTWGEVDNYIIYRANSTLPPSLMLCD